MTYIEFFDETAVKNVGSCMTDMPDKVIFIGDNAKLMKRHIAAYRKLFDCPFEYRSVDTTHLGSVVKVLSDIVESHDRVVLDIKGGRDVVLVAAGIILERYPRVILQRVSIKGGILRRGDDRYVIPPLSVEDNIRLYGGTVIYDDRSGDMTHRWDLTPQLQADIDGVWRICRRDPVYWNRQIKLLQVLEKHGTPYEKGLSYVVTAADAKEFLDAVHRDDRLDRGFLRDLDAEGLVSAEEKGNGDIVLRYKNRDVKKLLTKAGNALEMKIFSTAKRMRDENGNPVYNDVMVGVCIDWDGGADNKSPDVENEIDVMMTHGLIPVFVSCKNGSVKVDELYKLNTVAHRFGGEYSRKVLATNSLEQSGREYADDFRSRARDMGIRVVENIRYMEDKDLEKVLKNLWRS